MVLQLALLDVQCAGQADIQRPFELVVFEKQPKRSRNPLKLAGAIGATVLKHELGLPADRFQRAEHALSQDSARRLMLTLAGQPEGLRQVITHGAAAVLADALDCTAYHDWPAANAAGAEDRRLQVALALRELDREWPLEPQLAVAAVASVDEGLLSSSLVIYIYMENNYSENE